MRKAIYILIFIVIAAGLFTVYGIVTLTPDTPQPFVFNEPKLPPGITKEDIINAPADQNADLTPEQKKTQSDALAKMDAALKIYGDYESKVPQQAASTINTLNSAILAGKLPAYFPGALDPQTHKRPFQTISLVPDNSVILDAKINEASCTSKPTPASLLIGNEKDNHLECNLTAAASTNDRLFLGGPGNDEIIDTTGNRIIDAGSGDDKITVGPGRTIIYLDGGWGHDTLTINCEGAQVKPEELETGFPIPWTAQYTNFIVLSPRLAASDVQWNGLTLTSRSTGDSLTVNQNCFNLVSTAN